MLRTLSRLALAALVLVGAAACTPEELKAAWRINGYDYSRYSEADIQLLAFAITLNMREHAEMTKYNHVLSDAQLYRLRMCESTNNYGAFNRAGPFYGAYQFTQSTWNMVSSRHFGGRYHGVAPNTVPPGWQDAFTRALWSEQGRRPWPVCGLRV